MQQTAIVVTSIASPNAVLRELARGASERQQKFFIVGDEASPERFHLPGAQFFNIERQLALDFETARGAPRRHYARKNIGYLLALASGADIIIETDDDNLPQSSFWNLRSRSSAAGLITRPGWANVYRYFSRANVWPRGFPLDAVQDSAPELIESVDVDAPIQQGLADENPDVDAIYRLVLPLPIQFDQARSVALEPGVWCPFNSQNTTWWRDAFPLLYLPGYCSFRMTDIWRSFVAQRISWENGWRLLFHGPTVRQERNEHAILKDFEDEIPGYLYNRLLVGELERLHLKAGTDFLADNMRLCYEQLVRSHWIEDRELLLLEMWLRDLRHLNR